MTDPRPTPISIIHAYPRRTIEAVIAARIQREEQPRREPLRPPWRKADVNREDLQD